MRELHGAQQALEGGRHGHERHHVEAEVNHGAVEEHGREHAVNLAWTAEPSHDQGLGFRV